MEEDYNSTTLTTKQYYLLWPYRKKGKNESVEGAIVAIVFSKTMLFPPLLALVAVTDILTEFE